MDGKRMKNDLASTDNESRAVYCAVFEGINNFFLKNQLQQRLMSRSRGHQNSVQRTLIISKCPPKWHLYFQVYS